MKSGKKPAYRRHFRGGYSSHEEEEGKTESDTVEMGYDRAKCGIKDEKEEEEAVSQEKWIDVIESNQPVIRLRVKGHTSCYPLEKIHQWVTVLEEKELTTIPDPLTDEPLSKGQIQRIHKEMKKQLEREELERKEKERKNIIVPTPTLDLVACERAVSRYRRNKHLGEGKYGQVYQACRAAECRYAIKASEIETKGQFVAAEKDAYYLQFFASTRLEDQPIVPTFYKSWFCGEQDPLPRGTYYVVMDVWDGNMEKKAESRGKTLSSDPKAVPVYSERDLLRMFKVGAQIGKLGVVNPDIKPDQFLWNSATIVTTDFGFAGTPESPEEKHEPPYRPTISWPSAEQKTLGCPSEFEIVQCDTDRVSGLPCAAYLNVLLLEMYLLIYTNPLVEDTHGRLHMFGGFSDLDRDTRTNFCSKYTNAFVKSLRSEMATRIDTLKPRPSGILKLYRIRDIYPTS